MEKRNAEAQEGFLYVKLRKLISVIVRTITIRMSWEMSDCRRWSTCHESLSLVNRVLVNLQCSNRSLESISCQEVQEFVLEDLLNWDLSTSLSLQPFPGEPLEKFQERSLQISRKYDQRSKNWQTRWLERTKVLWMTPSHLPFIVTHALIWLLSICQASLVFHWEVRIKVTTSRK